MGETTIGIASFEERQATEARALPIIRRYINSLDFTLDLEDVDVETQKSDDIDFYWIRSNKGKHETITIEVKADTKIAGSGNFAFETISNEIKFTQGCFMRSKADYFYYFALETNELWIFPLDVVRQWFIREMSSRPNRFPQFRTHTRIAYNKFYTARGYLVPIVELQQAFGTELRYRDLSAFATVPSPEETIVSVFGSSAKVVEE